MGLRKLDASFVYFVRAVTGDGPIKIGCASDPADRVRQFARYSPVDLEVVAMIPGEGRIHAEFAQQRLRFEWFAPSAALLDLIAASSVGAIDTGHLPAPHWPSNRYGAAVRQKLDELARKGRAA